MTWISWKRPRHQESLKFHRRLTSTSTTKSNSGCNVDVSLLFSALVWKEPTHQQSTSAAQKQLLTIGKILTVCKQYYCCQNTNFILVVKTPIYNIINKSITTSTNKSIEHPIEPLGALTSHAVCKNRPAWPAVTLCSHMLQNGSLQKRISLFLQEEGLHSLRAAGNKWKA